MTRSESVARTLKRDIAIAAEYNAGGTTLRKVGIPHNISAERVRQIVRRRAMLDITYSKEDIFFIISELVSSDYASEHNAASYLARRAYISRKKANKYMRAWKASTT